MNPAIQTICWSLSWTKSNSVIIIGSSAQQDACTSTDHMYSVSRLKYLPRTNSPLGWPVEDRYARFQWEVMRQLLLFTNQQVKQFRCFWRHDQHCRFVLTHDVETAKGQAYSELLPTWMKALAFVLVITLCRDDIPLTIAFYTNCMNEVYKSEFRAINTKGSY